MISRRSAMSILRTLGLGTAVAWSAGTFAVAIRTSGATPSPSPMAFETLSTDPCPAGDPGGVGYVCLEYEGATYRGVTANASPLSSTGPSSLTIPFDALTRPGTATRVTADIGSQDLTVYRIAHVDPVAAVVMFVGQAPGIMTVWTRGGESPALIAGLCQYYLDPAWRACPAESP